MLLIKIFKISISTAKQQLQDQHMFVMQISGIYVAPVDESCLQLRETHKSKVRNEKSRRSSGRRLWLSFGHFETIAIFFSNQSAAWHGSLFNDMKTEGKAPHDPEDMANNTDITFKETSYIYSILIATINIIFTANSHSNLHLHSFQKQQNF